MQTRVTSIIRGQKSYIRFVVFGKKISYAMVDINLQMKFNGNKDIFQNNFAVVFQCFNGWLDASMHEL